MIKQDSGKNYYGNNLSPIERKVYSDLDNWLITKRDKEQ